MAYGNLGTAASVANTDVVVYTVPNNCKYSEVSLSVLNTGITDASIQVAISSTTIPASTDYIEKGAIIPNNGGLLSRSDLICSPGENIIVNANNADCVIRVNGKEIVK